MNFWIFGCSSTYAQYIIENIKDANHSITTFSKDVVNYDNPEGFIESIKNIELPDIIFFNANIQSDDFNYEQPIIDQKETFNCFINTWKKGFWFKLCLLKYLENKMKGTFVFSTSSIPYDKLTYSDCILYRILRSSEQQLIYSIGGKDTGLTVAGCCVSDMNETNKKTYAKLVSDHLINKKFNDNNIWSIVGGQYMHKMIMSWEDHKTFIDKGWEYHNE